MAPADSAKMKPSRHGIVTDNPDKAVNYDNIIEDLDSLLSVKLLGPKVTWQMVNEKVKIHAKPKKSEQSEEQELYKLATSGDLSKQSSGDTSSSSQTSNEKLTQQNPDFILHSSLKATEISKEKGRGFLNASKTETIKKGTLLLVEKPYMGICDLEAERKFEKWSSLASADTDGLACQFANEYSVKQSAMEFAVDGLYPFTAKDLEQSASSNELQDEDYVPGKDEEDSEYDSEEEAKAEEVDEVFQKIVVENNDSKSNDKKLELDAKTQKSLLLKKVRYNSLGFYTHSEQFCYPLHYKKLTGTGLYALCSMFNHSCEPNVARYGVGDVIFMVANSDIKPGEECCITYIGTDMLGEPKKHRDMDLNRDFVCKCEKCVKEGGEEEELVKSCSKKQMQEAEMNYVVVDAQMQAELSQLPSDVMVKYIDSILDGTCEDLPDNYKILGKDRQELRTTKAIAQIHMGTIQSWQQAFNVFKECIEWTEANVSKYDESLVVYYTSASICALAIADQKMEHGETENDAETDDIGDSDSDKKTTKGKDEPQTEGPKMKKRKVEKKEKKENENQNQKEEHYRTQAKQLAQKAAEVHNVTFAGPGPLSWFKTRYGREVDDIANWFYNGLNAAAQSGSCPSAEEVEIVDLVQSFWDLFEPKGKKAEQI